MAELETRLKEIEDKYFQLKGQLTAGRITRDQFEAALNDIMVQDEQGHWWMLGVDDAQWYKSDGEDWIKAEPPRAPRSQNAVTDVFQNLRLPSTSWKWVMNDPEEKWMIVENLDAVQLRLKRYDLVKVSAPDFLEDALSRVQLQFRLSGAEIGPIETRHIMSQAWAVCSIQQGNGVRQQLWARKTNPNQLLYISYTAAGNLFDKFIGDFNSVTTEFSS